MSIGVCIIDCLEIGTPANGDMSSIFSLRSTRCNSTRCSTMCYVLRSCACATLWPLKLSLQERLCQALGGIQAQVYSYHGVFARL